MVFKENSSNHEMHLLLAGNNWIFKKPCKVPEKDVWPSGSISTTRRSNCLLHVRMYLVDHISMHTWVFSVMIYDHVSSILPMTFLLGFILVLCFGLYIIIYLYRKSNHAMSTSHAIFMLWEFAIAFVLVWISYQ